MITHDNTQHRDVKHSPTPWRAMKTCTEPCILDANGKSVASCWNVTRMADANAAYIVKAVNAHERMVAKNARLRDALTAQLDYWASVARTRSEENLRLKIVAALGEEAWND